MKLIKHLKIQSICTIQKRSEGVCKVKKKKSTEKFWFWVPLKPQLFCQSTLHPPRLPPGINPSAPFVANETKLEFLWTRRWEEVKQEGVYYYTIQVWEFDEQIPLIISGLLLRVKWDLLAFLELQDDNSFKNREMLNHITILYHIIPRPEWRLMWKKQLVLSQTVFIKIIDCSHI